MTDSMSCLSFRVWISIVWSLPASSICLQFHSFLYGWINSLCMCTAFSLSALSLVNTQTLSVSGYCEQSINGHVRASVCIIEDRILWVQGLELQSGFCDRCGLAFWYFSNLIAKSMGKIEKSMEALISKVAVHLCFPSPQPCPHLLSLVFFTILTQAIGNLKIVSI